MGAASFANTSGAPTAAEAFRELVDAARCARGNEGYTGTIAEKSDFCVLDVPAGEAPLAFARRLQEAEDPLVMDKDGPACCIQLLNKRWLFFGSASW